MNSTIETAVVVNGASAACPLAGTRLSTQTSQSFAEVCASQMRPAPENGLASSTPPSSRTPSQSADLQSQPLIAANVKPSANRKSVSPNCPDSPPVAAASVPANQVFNFPPGLETSLVGMNLGSYENGNDQGDFGIRTELVSKSGVAATSIPPEPNSCDATAVSVPQFSDSISSDGSGERLATQVLSSTLLRADNNSPVPTADGAPDESQVLTAMKTVAAETSRHNDNAVLPDCELGDAVAPTQGLFLNPDVATESETSVPDLTAGASAPVDPVSAGLCVTAAPEFLVDRVQENNAPDNLSASSLSQTPLPIVPTPEETRSTVGIQTPKRGRMMDHDLPPAIPQGADEPRLSKSFYQARVPAVSTNTYDRHLSSWQITSLAPEIEIANPTVPTAMAADEKFKAPSAAIGAPQTISNSANSITPKAIVNAAEVVSSRDFAGAAGKEGQSADAEDDSSDASSHKGAVGSAASTGPVSPFSLEIAGVGPSNSPGPIMPAQSSEIGPSAARFESKNLSNSLGSSLPMDTPASATMGPVQMAQIVTKAAQSEMRIDLNTSAFGSVEVRAVVHANDVGVLIGSEKGDLRSLLASDLPGITNVLQQHELRLHDVSFHQHGFSFSGDSSTGGQEQSRSFVPKRILNAASPAQPTMPEPTPTTDRRASDGGLSVLA